MEAWLSSAHPGVSARFPCSCWCRRAVYRDKPGGGGAEWTERDPSRKPFICAPLLQLSHLLADFTSCDQHPRRARKPMIGPAARIRSAGTYTKQAGRRDEFQKEDKKTHRGQSLRTNHLLAKLWLPVKNIESKLLPKIVKQLTKYSLFISYWFKQYINGFYNEKENVIVKQTFTFLLANCAIKSFVISANFIFFLFWWNENIYYSAKQLKLSFDC